MVNESGNKLNKLVLCLATSLAFGLSGCGGGGGSSAPASQSISGGGVKGPLAYAEVAVYSFDATQPGFKSAASIDTGSTDANAAITGVMLPSSSNPPYIMEFTSTPGTTIDITTGEFPVITTMRTVITQALLDGGDEIYATPLTTMAVDIAVSNADSNVLPYAGDNDGVTTAAEFEAALKVAASQVVSTLGFGLDSSIDIFDTPPLVDSTTDTTEEQTDVAAYRAAVEAVTAVAYQIDQQTAGGTTDSVLAELAADLADGGGIDGSAGTEIDDNTLQVLQQDPASLPIPNSPTNQTVADIQAILVAEAATTAPTTAVTDLDVGGSITTAPAPAETDPDLDNDGHLNADDAFPTDASEYLDTDGDGTGNAADTDDDNDGWADGANSDDYPLDATLYIDPALNRDGDTILNGVDNCPLTTNEDQVDADNDGLGDVCDPATDTDGDGIANNLDNCPSQANTSQTNTDGDSKGDACDTDIDEDGTNNGVDAFPYDATETTDTDGDGLGDTTADDDDDNDGVVDASDTGVAPAGTSSAGVACSLLIDCDGDGYMDNVDQDPLDPAVTVNFAPVALDGTATTDEDTLLPVAVIDVLATDSNAGDTLTVTAVSTPSNGTAVANGNNIDYTPSPNFNGTDLFTYTVSDGNGGSDTGAVTVTIAAVNDAPTTTVDAETTNEDAPVTTVDVTVNDNDVDGDTLTAVLLTSATDGNVVDNGNNTFTYTPNTNFNGSDSFTYTVSDGNGGSATGTVNVTVNAVNDNPVAVADSLTTDEDTAGMTVDVTANDTDIDAGTILSVVAGNPTATHGTVVNNNDGTFTYTPDADFNGSDSFTYDLSDGTTGTATGTVNITVTPINDDPVAVDDSVTTDEDSSVSTGNVKSNDSDVDGDSLTATLLANASNGNVVANGSGGSGAGFTYTPDADFNGSDSFTYTLNDGNGSTAIGTVNITVNPVNDDPVAVADSLTTAEDTAGTTVDVTANDTDVDAGTVLSVVAGNPTAAHGTVVNNNDGTFTYTPNADFNGSDSFTYTLSDGSTGTATGTVNVTVTPVNDAPSASADAFPAGVATLAVLDVLANDTDVDGDNLTITAVSTGDRASTITHDGSNVSFTDGAGEGTTTFTYDIEDGNGGTATGISVTVTVTANIPPVATADSATTNEDTAVTTGNVLANDTDGGDGPGALSITDADTASANGGVVTNHGDGTFTYTPAADYFGEDTFTYTVSDTASSSVGTVTITVNTVNDAPVGVSDDDTTPEDTAFTTINVLTNDTDTENDTLSVSASDISSANGGVVVNNGDGTFDYTPPANFNGVDTFNYTVSDNDLTSSAQVSITVTAVNDAPTAVDDNETTTINTPVTTANVLANDSDVEGDTLSVAAGNPTATNGTVVNNNDGTFTYTPNTDYEGSDSFNYTVNDNNGGSDTGTVFITVTPEGTPIAMTILLGTTEGGLGAMGSWPGEAGVNEYEYWTDSYDAGTQTFAWADFVFNYSTNTFEADSSDADVALNGSGTWVNEGIVRVVEADDGNGNMTIGIRDEADTVDVEQVKLSARYVDIAGQAISGYLDAQWQSAMIDDATVFGANAKLISSYTFEMVTNGYLMHSGNWCQIDDPSRYATLNTTSVNNNCNGIDVPVGTDASGFATSLGQLEVATPFVDNNDFSTPDVAVSFGWEGSLNLRVEFAPGNVANYYVVDWSGDATTTTSLVATGAYTRDTTVQGVDMIRFVPPAAAYAQFPEVMAESSGYLVAMEGGFARLGDYILAGSVNSEIDTVLNGHALDDVLANFDAIEALSFNHIDFTGGITAYDLYYDAGVPTWCIDSLGLDGAGGVAQSDYVVCSGMPGSYSGSYSVDATTGVLTITDDVPETFYGKVVGYNDTYGAREVCWSLSSSGPFSCTEGDDFFSYMFADPTAATSAMNSLNGVSLCDYETADGSFDSYTDFQGVLTACGGVLTMTNADVVGTWTDTWIDIDGTRAITINIIDGGTGTSEETLNGSLDGSGTFTWSITNNLFTATDGVNFVSVWGQTASGTKVYDEDTYQGADVTTLDASAEGEISTNTLVKSGATGLACGYESGWDDTADGGMGAPIVPNSFDEYETLLADCHTPWEFSAANVAGGSFLDDGETMTFTLGGAAGTEASPGTGTAFDGVDTFNFEWYVEDATCTGCTYQYLVIYADYSMNTTLVPPGFWFRETEALININGTPGVAGAEYQFINYAEQSNYSDTDRATGSDAEIWGPSGMVLQ